MADIQFRLFGGTRPKPDRSQPTLLQRFVERVERETNGPTDDLVEIFREFRTIKTRRRA